MEFELLDISPEVKRAVKEMGFVELTPVQEKAIPLMYQKKDIIVQAPTGTGKTCAYAIPAVEDIDPTSEYVQMLVLCPTRELAIQSVEEIRKVFAYKEGVSALAIYGGQQIERQILALKKHPQIIVGTPGRVIDHLKRKTLRFQNIKLLVLDEADEMLNMGFRDDIDIILKGLPEEHQTVLFSATMPQAIKEISKTYQKNDVVSVTTKHDKDNVHLIKQYYVQLKEKQKPATLISLLDTLEYKLVLVFCRTKKRVDELTSMLQGYAFEVEALHGDLRQNQRDNVMRKFRRGEINILMATDVAARGLDIENVDLVINYDLTDVDEYYLHRIGRTGRAKKEGVAYTFITKSQHPMLKVYERLTNSQIEKFHLEESSNHETRRLDVFLKKTLPLLEEDLQEIENYLAIKVQELTKEGYAVSPLTLAAAFLQKATCRKEIEKVEEDETKKACRQKTQAGYQRFFINLGSLDDLRGSDLVKLICQKCHLGRQDFADVYMRNTYSFFELPKDKTELVLNTLNGETHNNRIIAVELSEKKDKTKEDRPSRKKDGPNKTRRPFREQENFRSENSKKKTEFSKDTRRRKPHKDEKRSSKPSRPRKEKPPFGAKKEKRKR